MMKRLYYIQFLLLLACSVKQQNETSQIMTVTGLIEAQDMGITLEHEHVTTDFIGAEKVDQPQYQVSHATAELLPYFQKLKASGVQTLIECTPKYIGRDVRLLREISIKTSINILTNTGYYAAADKKYLPKHAYSETAKQLAKRWIDEWNNGIDGTDIKPGFIKLGVGNKKLDSAELKIVKAGAIAHLATGLKIAIHTGSALAAKNEIEILQENGVEPKALIIVHAQNAISEEQIELARKGAWISLDGINESSTSIKDYIGFLMAFKQNQLLNKVLISHDDGWAVVQDNTNIQFERFGSKKTVPYSPIFDLLIPGLRNEGFTQEEIDQLLIKNPAEAFQIGVCRIDT